MTMYSNNTGSIPSELSPPSVGELEGVLETPGRVCDSDMVNKGDWDISETLDVDGDTITGVEPSWSETDPVEDGVSLVLSTEEESGEKVDPVEGVVTINLVTEWWGRIEDSELRVGTSNETDDTTVSFEKGEEGGEWAVKTGVGTNVGYTSVSFGTVEEEAATVLDNGVTPLKEESTRTLADNRARVASTEASTRAGKPKAVI